MKTNLFKTAMLILLTMAFLPDTLCAQPLTVKGIVTSAEYGSPIAGCCIAVKGKDKGTICGVDGEYSIEVIKGDTKKRSHPLYRYF